MTKNRLPGIMKPVVLFRAGDLESEEEFKICSQYLPTVKQRTECKDNLVIGRYSVLPYYHELQEDLKVNNSKLINSYNQHCWIANFDYYHDLKEFTPKSWTPDDIPYAPENQAYVVKGKTNSMKQNWNELMFAKNLKEAVEIAINLYKIPAIAEQGIVYREYVPLKTFEVSPYNGLRVTNEWRLFFWGKKLLASGYYWSNMASEESIKKAELTDDGLSLAFKCADIASKYVNFFVLDVAERSEGGWILIEVNDGQ